MRILDNNYRFRIIIASDRDIAIRRGKKNLTPHNAVLKKAPLKEVLKRILAYFPFTGVRFLSTVMIV